MWGGLKCIPHSSFSALQAFLCWHKVRESILLDNWDVYYDSFSGGCPDSFSRGGKKVFCYYEGKKSPQSIDPCPCTHLLYKNVIIDPDSQLRLSSQIRDDLHRLRSSKPSLAVLLSIGGDAVESDTFRAIVSRSVLLENSLDPSPRYPGYNSPDSFYQERRRVSTGFWGLCLQIMWKCFPQK